MRRSWSQRYARRWYGPEGEVVRCPPNFPPVPYCPSDSCSFFVKRNDPGKTESVSVHQSGLTEAFTVRSDTRRLLPKPPEFACLVDVDASEGRHRLRRTPIPGGCPGSLTIASGCR